MKIFLQSLKSFFSIQMLRMIHLVVCMDSSALGRFNRGTLSDQSLMELLIDDLIGKEQFIDDDGEYLDLRKWGAGWSVFRFDDQGSLEAINLNGFFDGGSIQMQWAPERLLSLNFAENQIMGSLETASFPPLLCTLDVSVNSMSGEFAIEGLPRHIEYIDISANNFRGILNTRDFPPSMRKFYGDQNAFTHIQDLTSLPSSFEVLSLVKNHLAQEEVAVGETWIQPGWKRHQAHKLHQW